MNGHDRNPVRRNEMNITSESEKNATAAEAPQPKTKRTLAKKTKRTLESRTRLRSRPSNPKQPDKITARETDSGIARHRGLPVNLSTPNGRTERAVSSSGPEINNATPVTH
jgi:hypothetical protein